MLIALGSATAGGVAKEAKMADVGTWSSKGSNSDFKPMDSSLEHKGNLVNSASKPMVRDGTNRRTSTFINRSRGTFPQFGSQTRQSLGTSKIGTIDRSRFRENTSYTFIPNRGNEPSIIRTVNGRTIRYIRSGTQRFLTRRTSSSRSASQRIRYIRPPSTTSVYSGRERSRVMYENDQGTLNGGGRTFYRRTGGNIVRYVQAPNKFSRITHYSRGGGAGSITLNRKVRTLSKSLILLFNRMTGLSRSFKTYQRVLANSFRRRDRTIKSILRTLNRLVRSNNKRKLYVTRVMNTSNPKWSVLSEVDGAKTLSEELIRTSKSKSMSGTSYSRNSKTSGMDRSKAYSATRQGSGE
ncbi:hypothetical protein K7432_014974 [Basidiobolus ranarum]|uniref:Uncharacterized protein n=1 Tax=Basidiobolus ranarum TaxID=34480 RepID=A0ABR2VNR0_9FUNG